MSSTKKQCISQRTRTFTKLFWLTLIALAILKLLSIGQNIHISKVALDSICHPIVTHGILVIFALTSAVKLYFISIFSYLQELQVFSQLFGVITYTIFVIYTTITSSLIFSQIYSSFVIWFSDSGTEIVMEQAQSLLRSYDQDFTICLTAVILSLCIIWIGGTNRAGPIVILLLWSFAMMLPLWESNPSFIAGSQACAILLDLSKVKFVLLYHFFINWITQICLQVLIGISSLAVPIVSSVKMAVAKDHVQTNPNSSFHRIYPECSSEASDESDSETVISSSVRSFRSNCPSPQRSESMLQSSQDLNKSLDSTKSWSPSIIRTNMCTSSVHSLNNSIADKQSSVLNVSFGGATKRNLFDNHQNGMHTFDVHHAQQLSSSQSRFSRQFEDDLASQKSMSMNSLNRRAPFYDVPDEFQSEITGLNISDSKYKRAPSNSFVALSTSESQLRQRRNLICPSRLHNITTATSPTSQASWVAGGYWNNSTSPQKQSGRTDAEGCVPLSLQMPELYPMMSRTSSQSSGFESQTSSVHNLGAPLADRDSRESSVCAAELASVFSSDSLQPCDSVSQCGVTDEHLPQLVYSAITSASQTFLRPSVDAYRKSGSLMNLNSPGDLNLNRLSMTNQEHQSSSSSPARSSVTYHQFGTQRVQNSRTYNFNKLTNNLPVIQSGSLLKSWRDRSTQQLSAGPDS